jgi:hypothetical protein
MKETIVKKIALALVAVSALGLTACGGETTPTTNEAVANALDAANEAVGDLQNAADSMTAAADNAMDATANAADAMGDATANMGDAMTANAQ